MIIKLELNEQIERVLPRGIIASRSYGSLLDILINNKFDVVFAGTFAEQSDAGTVIAFQICRRSSRVGI